MRNWRTFWIALAACFCLCRATGFAQTTTYGGFEDWQRPCPAVLPEDPLDSCFCNPAPQMFCTTSADVLILTRSNAEANDIVFVGNWAAPLVNTQDIGFDVQAGLRINTMLSDPCGCDLIFNYTGLPQVREVDITPNAAGQFFLFYSSVPVQPAVSYTVAYESEFHSGEIDVRTRQCSRLAPFAGLRFMKLAEALNIRETATDFGAFSATENQLLGPQFGVQAMVGQLGCSRLETLLKAGAYYNDIRIAAQAADVNGNTLSIERGFYQTAFQGELNVSWVIQCSPCALVRLGYYAMWLEGVALSPDQVDDFVLDSGEGTVDVGRAIYQGGFVGVEITL